MLKIIHVIGSARIGGIERLVLDLLRVQKENNDIEVDVIIGKIDGEFRNEFNSKAYKCFNAKVSSGYDLNIKKYIKVFKIFKKYNIIHFHSFNLFMMLAGIFSRKKIVYTEHGNFGFGRKKKKSDFVNNFFKKIILNQYVDVLTFNSNFTKSIAVNRFGLTKVLNKIVYNGISFEENIKQKKVSEKVLKKISGSFIIGTSSRFAGFKRIDRLVNAFSEYKYRSKSILLLVGDGLLRKDIEKLVEAKGIGDRVIFTGYKTNVREYQKKMDVCVFPSKNEPFGLVAIECLSLGKPTIVFEDGGGITEIVQKISPEDIVGNTSDLADRMNFYYLNRSKIDTKKNSRIQFSKTFNIKKMEVEFFKIYKQIK